MSFNGTVEVPGQIVTPDNHGAYIIIAAALLLVASVLVYFLRLGVRFGFNAYFGSDDILLTAGTVRMTDASFLHCLIFKGAGSCTVSRHDNRRKQWHRTEHVRAQQERIARCREGMSRVSKTGYWLTKTAFLYR